MGAASLELPDDLTGRIDCVGLATAVKTLGRGDVGPQRIWIEERRCRRERPAERPSHGSCGRLVPCCYREVKEILRPAAIQHIVDPDEVIAIGGRLEHQRYARPASCQLGARRVFKNEHRFHLGVQARGRRVHANALVSFQCEPEKLLGVRLGHRVDRTPHGNLHGGRGRGVAGLGEEFRAIADEQRARVGDAEPPYRPKVVKTRRNAGIDRNEEFSGLDFAGRDLWLGADPGYREMEAIDVIEVLAGESDLDRRSGLSSRREDGRQACQGEFGGCRG